jgi:hypothetical protein
LSERDTKFSRLLFRLAPSARPTEGTGFSLLPTPKSVMIEERDIEKIDKRRERSKQKNGRAFGMGLNEALLRNLLPTPTNSMVTYQDFVQAKYHSTKRPEYSEVALLPTPQARDYKGRCHDTQKCLPNVFLPTPLAGDADKTTKASHQNNLNKTFQTGGASQLNPLFVGEMMGFPTDWLVSPFLNGKTKASKLSEMQ